MAFGEATSVRAAARALMEGTPPSFFMISQLSGRTEGYFEKIAVREGWRLRDCVADGVENGSLEERLTTLASGMVREMEQLSLAALAGQYDKQRIDALGSMLKIVERLEDMMRTTRHSAEKETRTDAELAAALALVDARILELACELANTVGGKEFFAGDGSPTAG
jgi:hypothetical protein